MVASPFWATLRIAFHCYPQEGADQLQEVLTTILQGGTTVSAPPPGLPFQRMGGTTVSAWTSGRIQMVMHGKCGCFGCVQMALYVPSMVRLRGLIDGQLSGST